MQKAKKNADSNPLHGKFKAKKLFNKKEESFIWINEEIKWEKGKKKWNNGNCD